MTSNETHVIVGASLAGAKAAETLRDEGFDGRVVLIGDETDRPYERPPLSKEYLRGEAGREKVYVHPASFYADRDIELRLGRSAVALDTANRDVELDDGNRIGYDRLLLATGAEPRRLPIPGAELDGVHLLRDVDDCDALRARLDRGGAVVVVGAGWIGSEAAASAHACSPVASAIHVDASVSTTLGGVPRPWRGPATHWTAPNGGTRTSTLRPGAAAARAARLSFTAARSITRSGMVTDPGDQAIVRTTLLLGKAGGMSLDYRMHQRGDRWQVYDLSINGISLVASYRSQFDRIVRADSYDGLVARLKSRQVGVAAPAPGTSGGHTAR